jgi:hypothetical protein
VVALSIAAVVDLWVTGGGAEHLPSPFLPDVLRDLVELVDPEPEMEQAMASGQWDEIAARPRLDMHYVPETLPVARVKRVQASAIEHLSQHSELWARRSVSGVVPAKVLARVTEDDHAIYENIVFARLLDNCARWLNKRIAEVTAIAYGQSQAREFEKGDERHRLLRQRICALWGQAWFSEAEDAHSARQTLERLEQMRSQVARLRRSELYRRIPRSAKVPLRLRPTNIFQHDTRYRELRPLWAAMAIVFSRDRISETERYQAIAARQAAFQRYVLLLLCHALRDMGGTRADLEGLCYRVGPWDLRIEEQLGELRINLFACGRMIRSRTIVLLLSKEDGTESRAADRSVFFAEDLQAASEVKQQDHDSRVLNPFQFFAVERVRQLLEVDLAEEFLSQYPPAVTRVPRTVQKELAMAAPEVFKPEDEGVVLLPFAGRSAEELRGLASRACAAHPDTEASLLHAIGLNQWVLRCRACGVVANASAISADQRAMRLTCVSCRLVTTVKTVPSKNIRSSFEGDLRGFEYAGALELDLGLPQ